jgi:hypothetical protein
MACAEQRMHRHTRTLAGFIAVALGSQPPVCYACSLGSCSKSNTATQHISLPQSSSSLHANTMQSKVQKLLPNASAAESCVVQRLLCGKQGLTVLANC